jgi:hypothetical protein
MVGRGGGGDEMETYDGPAWRLISTLCGESASHLPQSESIISSTSELYRAPLCLGLNTKVDI